MSLDDLEIKKLLIDLKYYKEELDIKLEMVNDLDIKFNNAVESYMSNNEKYKEIWEKYKKKKEEKFDDLVKKQKDMTNEKSESKSKSDTKEIIKIDKDNINEEYKSKNKNKAENFKNVINEDNNIHKDKNKNLKFIYREIVKKSHPDKISHLSKEEKEKRGFIYKEATNFYEKNNLAKLIYCAIELGINVELKDKKIIQRFKKSVKDMKKKSSFLEQTFTWKWYNSDKKTKEKLIEIFIKQELSKNLVF